MDHNLLVVLCLCGLTLQGMLFIGAIELIC